MKQLSIVIPYHNDIDTLIGTLESLYKTIDIDKFEVVIVNDGSTAGALPDSYPLKLNMKHVDHFVNLGVGQAFDTGVRLAESDNVILMGADIRFKTNDWASRMLKVLAKEDKALVCTACGSTKNERIRYGADVVFFIRNSDLSSNHPRKKIEDYTSILEGKWRKRTGRGVYAIPSLMGAFYGVRRDWYHRLRGFQLHYKWGVLEPYISLKSWLLGGKVLIDTDNITYHIFNRNPQREADFSALAYNQLMMANVVFQEYGVKYAEFLANQGTNAYETGADMMMDKIESIKQLTRYLKESAVMTPKELESLMVEMSLHYNREDMHPIDPRTVV